MLKEKIEGGTIPFFILHWPTVWPLFVLKPKRFNFFALSLGSIIPDLEIPFLFLLTGDTWSARGFMHSILGALTLDLLIVVLATVFIVPRVLNYMARRMKNEKTFIFSKVDLRDHKTNTTIVVYSGLIGTLSHVLIDVINHPYNPLTYPFAEYYSFNLILFNDLQLANIIIWIVLGGLLIVMMYYWYLRNLL
ncbi:DUF4184 family protein [[Eubacterium] cellulosolvens]